MGPHDTFLEFDACMAEFMAELPRLPDRCVLFGHIESSNRPVT